MKLRCLSLYQPYATLFARAEKRNETRGRLTHIRGRIAIHATKKFWPEHQTMCYSSPFREALTRKGHPLYKGEKNKYWLLADPPKPDQ